ncbi:MAG: GNAT family N-acetyltransferase [Patescibacteria group bacterium]
MSELSIPNEDSGKYPLGMVNQVVNMVDDINSFPDPAEPILGQTDEVVMAANLKDLILRPRTILVTLQEDKTVLGFSLAVPVNVMDPSRESESHQTAYIYYSAISPARQGEGLIRPLMNDMFIKLQSAGYSYVERDAQIGNGYADNIEASYPKEAILQSFEHEPWPEHGRLRHMRMDLDKALSA